MRLVDLLASYKKKDPAARSGLEIVLLYPGVKAIALHRVAHALFRSNVPFLPRFIAEWGRWLTGIEIHPGAQIGKGVVFDHGMGIVIGETAIVGDDVLIFHGVTLGSSGFSTEKRHPTVGSHVVLGAGCKVLGNIQIGDHAKIGANSVVIADVPPFATAVGIPAQIIPKRSKWIHDWNMNYDI